MDAQGLTLFNAIATAGKTIYEIAQGTSKLEEKQQLMEVYDTLMNLKRKASELGDENHDLKGKLRFRSDDFDFKIPFWFEKKHPDRALCAKCFSQHVAAPVSAPYSDSTTTYRRCLTCMSIIEEGPRRADQSGSYRGPAGPDTWMG
jgi:hypothetical protein